MHAINALAQMLKDCFILFFADIFGSRRHLTTFEILCNTKIHPIKEPPILHEPLQVIQVSIPGDTG